MSGAAEDSDALAGAITRVVPPLLDALATLRLAARHVHPLHIAALARAVAPAEPPLREARPDLHGPVWPARLHWLRDALDRAGERAERALEGLRLAGETGDPAPAWRAPRRLAEACEALWPVAAVSPVVSRFFLDGSAATDTGPLDRIEAAEAVMPPEVLHFDNERGDRGGYSLFLPSPAATPEGVEPPALIVALHGGRGHGRAFLWNWLPAARASGCILVAPTATGETWALQGEDVDTGNLMRILDEVRVRRAFDPGRLLLTGMSDGGTFCWVTGLQTDSAFTHLAPFSASFHPLLVEFADPRRLRGLPIHIVHGAQDWMFPPEVARTAAEVLARSGAAVVHREVPDLPHAFAPDFAGPVLRWFLGR